MPSLEQIPHESQSDKAAKYDLQVMVALSSGEDEGSYLSGWRLKLLIAGYVQLPLTLRQLPTMAELIKHESVLFSVGSRRHNCCHLFDCYRGRFEVI